MSQQPFFPHPLSKQLHDELWQWAQIQYAGQTDWQTLWLNGQPLGKICSKWSSLIKKDWDDGIRQCSDGLHLMADSWLSLGDRLQNLALIWKQTGVLQGWRDELFDVCDFSGNPLFPLERAAFRPFGLTSHAVHLNGLTFSEGEWHFWIGQRSAHKAVDPNKLDNLVGGGVSSNETIEQALMRESEEEAGICLTEYSDITVKSRLHSLRPVSRGLHNEILHIFDLVLSASVIPQNQDGEVSKFERMNINQIIAAMSDKLMMADAQLVTLDAFSRYGLLETAHPLTQWLQKLRCSA